jgi:hypothetical protein
MIALVHCSYHKCLTVYYQQVMTHLLRHFGGYHHFNSDLESFYRGCSRYRVTSVNNHSIDLDRLGDYRITRFVRDPRDLIVSGYFYHRRGAERWCLVQDPTPADWAIVNGHMPSSMRPGESFAGCLQRLNQEDGLIAEMEFRTHHFASMRRWPDDPRIRMLHYESILGNEKRVFGEIFAHYGLSWPLRLYGRRLAERFKATGASARRAHIRDSRPGQWREVLTPRVAAAFDALYGDLPRVLGY